MVPASKKNKTSEKQLTKYQNRRNPIIMKLLEIEETDGFKLYQFMSKTFGMKDGKCKADWIKKDVEDKLWTEEYGIYTMAEKKKLAELFRLPLQTQMEERQVSAISNPSVGNIQMSSNRDLPDAPTQRNSSDDDVVPVDSNASHRNRVIVQQEQELALNREMIVQLEKEIEQMRLDGARKLPTMKNKEFYGELRCFMRNNIPKKVVEETDKAMCIRREATSEYSKINSITFEYMMDTINWSVRLTVEGAKKNRSSSGNPKRSIFSLLASYVSLLQRLELNIDDKKYTYARNREVKNDIGLEYDYTTLLHAYKIITELPEQ